MINAIKRWLTRKRIEATHVAKCPVCNKSTHIERRTKAAIDEGATVILPDGRIVDANKYAALGKALHRAARSGNHKLVEEITEAMVEPTTTHAYTAKTKRCCG